MTVDKSMFETVDALMPEYIEHWVNFASIESPTCYKKGVDDAADYICGVAAKHGWKIEKCPMEVSGDAVCITMNPEAPGAPIALSGHVDTVHPLGSFGNPPVKVEGDTIYGPGVNDCKGGVIAALMAMDVLERAGYKERPVLLILQTDEETNSVESDKATVRYMCEKAKDAAAFLNLEGFNYGHVTVARKGISRYEYYVHGKAMHSANCFNGINAITESCHKIIELEKMKDRNGITCNCGVIEGGTVSNAVAGECHFSADVRFITDEEMRISDEKIKEVAEHSYVEGSSCDLVLLSRRVAMPMVDRNVQLFNRLNEILAAYGLETLEMKVTNGGSDAADVTCFGIPCLDSLGTHGWDIHSPKERSDIPTLADSAKRMCAFIRSF